MTVIAGHVFDPISGACSCGRRFSDISGATEKDIERPYFAHVGNLTETEYREIVAERDRLWVSLFGGKAERMPDADDFSG